MVRAARMGKSLFIPVGKLATQASTKQTWLFINGALLSLFVFNGFLLTPQLRVAALNEPMNGRMQSTRGIDERCWEQSRAANLTGAYRGFISNRLQHIYSIIHKEDRNLPVGNLQVKSETEVIFLTLLTNCHTFLLMSVLRIWCNIKTMSLS